LMGLGSSSEREDPWKTVVWETEYDDDGKRKDEEPLEEGVFISISTKLQYRLFLEQEEEEEEEEEENDVGFLPPSSDDIEEFLDKLDEDTPLESTEESKTMVLQFPDMSKSLDDLERYQHHLEMIEEEEFERITAEIDSLSRRYESNIVRRGTECFAERKAAAECYTNSQDYLDCTKAVEAYSRCAQTTKEGNLAKYKKFLGRE